MWRTSALALCFLVACGGDPQPEGSPQASIDATPVPTTIEVTSPAFGEGDEIPVEFTCDGEGVSPPLAWAGVPEDAAELQLLVDDPDAPDGTFTHWLVTGIDPSAEGAGSGEVPGGGTEQPTSFGEPGYGGPCPPEGDEPHRYRFTVVAVSAAREALASGTLTATYGR